MKTQRVLMASYGLPQDDRDCGSRRLFDFVSFLREAGWAIDFVAANGLGDARYERALRQMGVAVHGDAPRPKGSGESAGPDLLERLARAGAFDLALFAFWPVAELYLPVLRRVSPDTRVIVDSVDLHFLRGTRRILHHVPGCQAHPLLDIGFAEQMVGELNTYAAADAVLTVSQKEAELLRDLTSDRSLAEVAPLCEDMAPSPLPLTERSGILLLGSYKHLPNVEALEYLLREVLPRVDRRLRDCHPVYVVGNGLDERLRRSAEGTENVRMVGWVPSVVPYFHRARISVIPLLYGAGVKGKMVQALMTATPTVSTSIGAEGLNLRDEEHFLVADDPDRFARSIERLLQDDLLWGRLASSGRACILRTHGRSVVRSLFLQLLEAVLARPAKPAMLTQCTRQVYQRRLAYQNHQRLLNPLRKLVAAAAPADGIVLVASGGNEELLQLGDCTTWHFPRMEDGRYRRDGFADGKAAISHLESLRAHGGDVLLLPSTASWMLELYPELKGHLEESYRLAGRVEAGLLFDLRKSAVHPATPVCAGGVPFHESVPQRMLADRSAPTEMDAPRLIAFYLPQYHPIPENNRWWGEGFTEWQNVSRAQPLFPGHHQPHLPADLGFYDLRLEETREQQAALAHRYGIHGFCYYHFWFHGKRLLERPFNEVLRSRRPDFPFCLCWANEPWSRRWDGSDAEVLQPQSYSAEDDRDHFRWLLDALADPRAITIAGRPVFLVYQGRRLPDPARTTELWRREAERAGLKGLYLMAVESGWDAGWDATQVGFDAKLLFQPQFSLLNTLDRLEGPNPRLRVYDYQKAWPVLANPEPVSYLRYHTVFPSWDNTPRRGEKGWVVHNSTPEAYQQWLRLALERAMVRPKEQRVVFLNAWNEWAEGCHLEPDRRDGHSYLQATQSALESLGRTPTVGMWRQLANRQAALGRGLLQANGDPLLLS
jgi:glycosyltransferase involved in cell wall biosynthesis